MASRRQLIWDRARGRCEYCQLEQADTTLPHEIDHIRAKKHRGPTSLKNTYLACAQCNAAKGPNAAGYDPDTDQLVPVQPAHRLVGGPLRVGRARVGGEDSGRPRDN
ncbi:MAG: HNH endonuclease [Zavarzinella sp.]|nr:HNH endonuclease [Zavarzinella sp.]